MGELLFYCQIRDIKERYYKRFEIIFINDNKYYQTSDKLITMINLCLSIHYIGKTFKIFYQFSIEKDFLHFHKNYILY